ncbi:MAG: 2OG-Fe(II) oxygenase, partial [Nitrospinota bacterium]|nr:2OG-Fe(II) oxygenase [Nitrospinota bacterium]
MTVESATIHPAMAAAIEALDVPRLKTDFENQNEFVVIENFLPFAVLEKLLSDLQGLLSCVHRNYIPTYKKGGSVGRQNIDRFSPTFGQLYNDPALLKFFNHLTGDHLMDCPSDDPHTYALYCYTEPDDHVGFHYDTSYYRGKRYTVLVGLVDNSSCRLVCQLHRDDP